MGEGQLIAWSEEQATIRALDVASGDLIAIDGAGPALVTALFANGDVQVSPLTTRRPTPGARVQRIGPYAICASPALVGRGVDVTGAPLDDAGPVPAGVPQPVFARDPYVVRDAVQARLSLGTLVFDAQHVYATGVSLTMSGGPPIAHHVMAHQHALGRICVIASPLRTRAAYVAARRAVPCIQVAASDEATAVQQWLVPWAALAVASSLRSQGHDVVVLLDSLDAWKPHVASAPWRGSWATQVAQLTSRAYASSRGSVSLIARAAEVTPAISAAFDASLDFSLAVAGTPPPRGTKLVRPPIKLQSPQRLAHAVLGASSPASARLREALRLREDTPIDTLEQLLCVLAVDHLHELASERVHAFMTTFLAALRRDHAAHLAAIRSARKLTDDDLTRLLDVAAAIERA